LSIGGLDVYASEGATATAFRKHAAVELRRMVHVFVAMLVQQVAQRLGQVFASDATIFGFDTLVQRLER
jgi:hypothetical protein